MKKYFISAWFILISIGLYLHFFQPIFLQEQLQSAFGLSIFFGYALFLILGSLRGFTLIPVTYLILLGIIFFNPLPLFVMIVIGIITSSISIYYFSEFMHFDAVFEKKYPKQILQLKSILSKHELPIIIFWSGFPFLPTDLICYVAGALRIDVKKFILGVILGEGFTSGLYIFFGHQLIKYLS